MTWMDWYNNLWKPSWTPAPSTIGLIWRILYPVIVLTFGFVFVQAIRRRLPWSVVVPFAVNLVANLIFTPIQFGLRNLPLAAVDILIAWGTIIWIVVAACLLMHRFVNSGGYGQSISHRTAVRFNPCCFGLLSKTGRTV